MLTMLKIQITLLFLKSFKPNLGSNELIRMPKWTRTTNLQLRRLLLYPIELWAHASVKIRTDKESGKQDSNLRLLGPKPSALTGLSYSPTTKNDYIFL